MQAQRTDQIRRTCTGCGQHTSRDQKDADVPLCAECRAEFVGYDAGAREATLRVFSRLIHAALAEAGVTADELRDTLEAAVAALAPVPQVA